MRIPLGPWAPKPSVQPTLPDNFYDDGGRSRDRESRDDGRGRDTDGADSGPMEATSRRSEKERASDLPSWARNFQKDPNESCEKWALMY